MAKGAWTLGEFPLPLVRVSCARCGRAGQYRKATLLQRYGPDMACRSCGTSWHSAHGGPTGATRAW
jgi:hypothetical protein